MSSPTANVQSIYSAVGTAIGRAIALSQCDHKRINTGNVRRGMSDKGEKEGGRGRKRERDSGERIGDCIDICITSALATRVAAALIVAKRRETKARRDTVRRICGKRVEGSGQARGVRAGETGVSHVYPRVRRLLLFFARCSSVAMAIVLAARGRVLAIIRRRPF